MRHQLVDLIRRGGERVEVVAEELEGVFPLHAGHRLFHVVLDVLREVEIDAGIMLKLLLNRGDQLFFFAVKLRAPFVGGLQIGKELDVVEGADVCTVIGAAHLREALRHLRKAAQHAAKLVGEFG